MRALQFSSGFVLLSAALAGGPLLAASAHGSATHVSAAADASAPKLHAAMRALWHGHIVHAREYALATHSGNGAEAQKAADAVVANARQISDAVAGFYGKAGGDRMMQLLAGHWGAVKAMTDAQARHDA